MKKELAVILSLAIIAIIAVSAFATIEIFKPSTVVASKKPFYVGVTYCGNSTNEAEQLIDKVRTYTNLFVLQSGPLMYNLNATEQICDYAVNSGLSIIVCYTTNSLGNTLDSFLNIAQMRWGSHFLGLYFNDEPAAPSLSAFKISIRVGCPSASKTSARCLSFSTSFPSSTVLPPQMS